jgi:alanine racemase
MNIISISRKNIIHNYEYLHSLQNNAEIFPVLKSNAYGHGLEQVAKILNKTDAPFIAVDSYPEYVVAKQYSNKQLLIL